MPAMPTDPPSAGLIRPLSDSDEAEVSTLIRATMREFLGSSAGDDPELRSLTGAYPGGAAQFFVVEVHGRVLGGGGFGPLGDDVPTDVCELRKMYFDPALRGRGLGRRLLETLLDAMRAAGYRKCYLETTTSMSSARRLYAALGFRQRSTPLGEGPPSRCDLFFERDL